MSSSPYPSHNVVFASRYLWVKQKKAQTAVECVMESMKDGILFNKGQTDILPLPTPSIAGVYRLVGLLSQGPLILIGGHWGPQVCLCHRPMRLPLSGQGPVTSMTSRGGDSTLCWGHKWWQWCSTLTATVALAPSLAACFLRGLVGHPGLPLCWWFGEYFALGCQADVWGEGLLEVLESKGFIHQAQGMPGGSFPGCKGFVALLHPGCLPCWGSWGSPSWRLEGRISQCWLPACGWHSHWWGKGIAPAKCLKRKTQTCLF